MRTSSQATLSLSWHKKSADSFARVLRTIAAQARRLTEKNREATEEAVHEVRLMVKRVRALLWFAQPVLAKAQVKALKTELRRTAHLLAAHRDLHAAQVTLKRLAEKAGKDRARAAVENASRALTRHENGAAANSSQDSLRAAGKVLCAAVDTFTAEVERVEKWPSTGKRTAKAFRSARRAGRKAQRTREDLDFHDWRKKTKRLLFLLELRDAEPSDGEKRLVKHVDALQSTLGDDHDCVVTAQQLPTAEAPRDDARLVVKLLRKRQGRLRRKTRKLARRVQKDA
ncbi:MAG: CHAD domain-containing protein [Verrucomicrobiota bacterium]